MVRKTFNWLSDKVIHAPKRIIALILVITAFLAIGLPKIQIKMGNDVFVDTNSAIYKDTETYQKQFGGDNAFLLLTADNKNDSLVNHKTFAKVAAIEKDVQSKDHIVRTTSVVSLLNEELQSSGAEQLMNQSNNTDAKKQEKLQKDLMANLSKKDSQKIQEQLMASLSTGQKDKVSKFTQTILTTEQKTQLATQGTQTNLNSLLNANQQKQVMGYVQTILDTTQKQNLAKSMLNALPSVEKMTTPLLQDLLLKDGKVSGQLSALLPKNGRHLLLNLTIDKSDMDTDVTVSKDLKKVIANHKIDGVKIRLAGQPAIMGEISGEVITTMAIMLGLAIVMMVIILSIVFHARRRLLSLLFVLVGLVWTFGIMGWLNISLTLATMATLPILIGLGTDFGVQFQNRYEEEYRQSRDYKLSVHNALMAMGPAVGSALIVMIFAFLTMYLSKAPLMQQFGLTLAIGVFAVYIVELLLMFTSLSIADRHNPELKKAAKKESMIGRFLGRYATFVTKHAWPVVIIGILLGVAGFAVENKVPVETDMTHMIPQSMQGLKNTNYLQDQVGSTTYLNYMVEDDDVTNKQVLIDTNKLANRINKKYDDVLSVTTLESSSAQLSGSSIGKSQSNINSDLKNIPSIMRAQLVSKNHHYSTIQFKIDDKLSSADQNKLMKKINHDIKRATKGKSYKISPAGAQVMMLVGLDNISSNRTLMMVAGVLVIVIVLFLIYRRLSHALLPAFPIIIVLGVSPLTLFLLGKSYNPLTLGLSALVLGIGTEFTILILERYREELVNGLPVRESMITAVKSVGSAITVSGLTVVGGFFAIIFVSFPVLSSFGLITVLDTAYALIAALTLLPAMTVITQGKEDKHMKRHGLM